MDIEISSGCEHESHDLTFLFILKNNIYNLELIFLEERKKKVYISNHK